MSEAPVWELTREVHNLPVVPGRVHVDLLENAVLSRNRSAGYLYLGRTATPDACSALVERRTDVAPLHSFVWLMPSATRIEMASACFGVTLPRWRPTYHTRAVSGRKLCLASQSHVTATESRCAGPPALRPLRRRDAAIFILAQNSAHTTYGRNSRQTLERCLSHLYAFYAHVDAADVLIFHNGDFAPADQAEVQANRSRLFFELLTDEYWRTPEGYFEHEKTFKASRFALGYRHSNAAKT